MTRKFSIIFILLVVKEFVNGSGSAPLVETDVGTIQGVSANDGNYSMYLGIPYGQINEDNPFGLSVPYPRFNQVFVANDDSSICPQNQEPTSSLDCLRLNIYVPNVAPTQRLPVLVVIHGGAFSTGHSGRSAFGPKYLVRHDVILVTLNYRLGVYGFMCLHTEEVPGNQGLKDQLLALRWIKNNIGAFGGDPDLVTLCGESAGARSVDLHLLSPQEKLFNRAIIQSGSVFNPGWFPEPDVEAPIKLARTFGFQTSDLNEAIKYLSKMSTDSVITAAAASNIIFRLCVEKEFANVERLIIHHPLHKDVPKAADMPILIGFNDHEMLLSFVNRDPEFYRTLNTFSTELTKSFDLNDEKLYNLENIIRRFYIGDEELTESVQLQLADLSSDTTYVYSTFRNIERYLKNRANKIFFYVFEYVGGRNFVKSRRNVTIGGAVHADEKGYLFDIDFLSQEPLGQDKLVLDRMTTMWTNFVKYGDPTPETTYLLPVKWEPVTHAYTYNYLGIGAELLPGRRPFHQRIAFWDLLYKQYAEYELGFQRSTAHSLFTINYCIFMIAIAIISILH